MKLTLSICNEMNWNVYEGITFGILGDRKVQVGQVRVCESNAGIGFRGAFAAGELSPSAPLQKALLAESTPAVRLQSKPDGCPRMSSGADGDGSRRGASKCTFSVTQVDPSNGLAV